MITDTLLYSLGLQPGLDIVPYLYYTFFNECIAAPEIGAPWILNIAVYAGISGLVYLSSPDDAAPGVVIYAHGPCHFLSVLYGWE